MTDTPYSQDMERAAHLAKLQLKALEAKTASDLYFIIVNDAIKLLHYDRAILWKWEADQPKIVAVSGQVDIAPKSALEQQLQAVLESINTLQSPQRLDETAFKDSGKEWQTLLSRSPIHAAYWVPLGTDSHSHYFVWFEQWDEEPWSDDDLQLMSYLGRAFHASLEHLHPRWKQHVWNKRIWMLSATCLLATLMLVHVPLRIVAPCEVIPEDPVVIATPISGVIDEVIVSAGDRVMKGDPLIEYQRESPIYEARVARKNFEVADTKYRVALAATAADRNRETGELYTLQLQRQRALAELEHAEYRLSQIRVKAPIEGTIEIDRPENFRNKPVEVGEKILTIFDPAKTIVKIWIPQGDNVTIDKKRSISVLLSTRPSETIEATLRYISGRLTTDPKGVPSYEAEADWNEPFEGNIGLTGTAILYGEKVSLFYWLIRRPWATVREFLAL